MTTQKSPNTSRNRHRRATVEHDRREYPLQGTALDLATATVREMPDATRQAYIRAVLRALASEIRKDTLALKSRTSFGKEMKDLRRLALYPTDAFLLTDDRTGKRNVLGVASPGKTHAYWSRQQMWKMKTKQGELRALVLQRDSRLVGTLMRVYRKDKEPLHKNHAFLASMLRFFEFTLGSGTSFPPFHARFLADTFLPPEGGLVIDPCAGWGGRMLGTLCVPREGAVRYVGVDPNKNNRFAYEGLQRRVSIYLRREIRGARSAQMFYRPFEDWIRSTTAQRFMGTADLCMTSPPYFGAENYDPDSSKQSANRYAAYEQWRTKFYLPLVKGAYDLLKPGGVFVLNIADVKEAMSLERDARRLARDVGFVADGFYKLAMPLHPSLRKAKTRKFHKIVVHGKVMKYEPVFVFRKP